MQNEFTYMDLSEGAEDEHGNEVDCPPGVYVCNDCGAYAPMKQDVEHHKTCTPGDAEKWRQYYEDNKDDPHENCDCLNCLTKDM